MITKEEIEELREAHAGKPSRRSFIELAHSHVPALIARVEELKRSLNHEVYLRDKRRAECQQAKADAWDEGYATMRATFGNGKGPNPYRKDGE